MALSKLYIKMGIRFSRPMLATVKVLSPETFRQRMYIIRFTFYNYHSCYVKSGSGDKSVLDPSLIHGSTYQKLEEKRGSFCFFFHSLVALLQGRTEQQKDVADERCSWLNEQEAEKPREGHSRGWR